MKSAPTAAATPFRKLATGVGESGNAGVTASGAEYVIDGDREYRQLEAQLHDATNVTTGTPLRPFMASWMLLTMEYSLPRRKSVARPRFQQ